MMNTSGRGCPAGAIRPAGTALPSWASGTASGITDSIRALRSSNAQIAGAPMAVSAIAACGPVPPQARRTGSVFSSHCGPPGQSQMISPPMPAAARPRRMESRSSACASPVGPAGASANRTRASTQVLVRQAVVRAEAASRGRSATSFRYLSGQDPIDIAPPWDEWPRPGSASKGNQNQSYSVNIYHQY